MLYPNNKDIKVVEAVGYVSKPGEVVVDSFMSEVTENAESEELVIVNGLPEKILVKKQYCANKVFFSIAYSRLSVAKGKENV